MSSLGQSVGTVVYLAVSRLCWGFKLCYVFIPHVEFFFFFFHQNKELDR